MSQSLTSSMKRISRHSPIAFFRQCRADTCRTSGKGSDEAFSPSKFYYHAATGRSPQYSQRSVLQDRPASLISKRCATRTQPFSTSTPCQATTVLQNPRVDEDGNEMTIEISDRAAKRLQQITSPSSPYSSPPSISGGQNKNNQHNHLRVTVTSGGCHGFQYLMSLEPSSAIEADTDTIFASSPPSSASGSSAKVVMDESSLELLKGSTIDYTTELIGSQFKIVGNPRAKSSCGCGTSFDIED